MKVIKCAKQRLRRYFALKKAAGSWRKAFHYFRNTKVSDAEMGSITSFRFYSNKLFFEKVK